MGKTKLRKSLQPYANDYVIKIHQELENSKDNQRALILITNSYLEILVNYLIEHKCKNYKKIRNETEFSYFYKILLLNEMGLIDDEHYVRLEIFRKIRNQFSHNPLFSLTEDDIKKVSNNVFTKIDDLYGVCNVILLQLWNNYLDIFVPKFMPTMLKNKK